MAVAAPITTRSPSEQQIRQKATIFQWNACGLGQRLPDFRRFVQKHQFPIVAISESRLSTDIRLSGYAVLRSSTGVAKTRVLLCVRNDLTFMQHNLPPNALNELAAITVRHAGVSFTVIAAYIPPHASLNTQRLEDIIRRTPPPHILTGDFNAHHPSWGSKKTTVKGRRLLDIADRFSLCVINTGQPTFYRGRMSSATDVTMVSSALSTTTSWYADIESHGSNHVPTYIIVDGLPSGRRKSAVQFVN